MPLTVFINECRYEVPDGSTVLQATRQAGIEVPTLCHDDRLRPSGACRTCLVEVGGSSRWVAACATPVTAGMRIATHTAALEAYRRDVLAMLANAHPGAAAAEAGDTPFRRWLSHYGVPGVTASSPEVASHDLGEKKTDCSHPFISIDMARCIDCYRCVRICDELQGQGVWGLRGRGREVVVSPDAATLAAGACVSCGACVDTCPTGALQDASITRLKPANAWTRTVCPYCGVGCEVLAGSRDGRLVAMRPAADAVVNRGHLCVKGRYGFEFAHAPDRVTTPMIRKNGNWREVSWAEAIEFAATRLAAIRSRFGPDAIGVLGSARATNEDNYIAQKFTRVVLGTHNVDCCARVCHAPSAAGLKQVLGAGLATNSFEDLERARAILVWGANSTESHPIVGARIKQAVRHGTPLIVVDPRRTELARLATVHLQLQPGTDIALANAMAQVIVHENLHDQQFVADRTSGLTGFATFLAAYTPEKVAAICGLEPERIRDAARLYATARPAMSVHGLGVTEQVQGTETVTALINLALLTGNLGKPGAGVNPLRGQNNVQGAAHMGCDPDVLPGSMPLALGRDVVEQAWGVPLPAVRGHRLPGMIDAALAGRFKALWAIGYDILLTNPNALLTTRALDRLDLVIVQDLFLTTTARRVGTLFLPACSTFEKDGTFMNAERRIQRVRAVIPPAGASRPDWQIVCAVAQAMGQAHGFTFERAEDVWNEVRSICEGARGMSYARLETAGLQWPCPDETGAGTPILHARTFSGTGRAAFRTVDLLAAQEVPTAAFPLMLITGRTLYQFNAGTMTSRSGMDRLCPEDRLGLSPADAIGLGVHEGERVRVTSRYGQAVLPAHVSTDLVAGQLFATFHTPDAFVNLLTGPYRDGITGTPAYKMTAVRLERLG